MTLPDDQLPAVIEPIAPPALATPADTYIVPALIADLGDQAGWRYVEFFVANINNDHTRRAYARACSRFFAWCENRGLSLTAIRRTGPSSDETEPDKPSRLVFRYRQD